MSFTTVSDKKNKTKESAEEVLRLVGISDQADVSSPRTGLITTLDEIKKLETEWQALGHVSCEPLSHFQSYDWCMNWMMQCHDASREDIVIVPVWKNKELVALLPLMITAEKGGMRIMRFLGEPLIEYSNILIDRKKISIEEVVRAFNEVRQHVSVDAVAVKNFPSCSYLFDIFGDDKISRSASQASSVMDLTRLENWDTFRASMSRSARKSRNKRRRKLEALGEVTYRVFEGGTQDYENVVYASRDMKKVWLKETGRNAGELFSGHSIDAIAHMNGSLEHMNGAIAGALYVGDQIVATEVGFVKDKTYLSYIGAFDWNMRDYSVGKLQIEEALKWSLENGIHTYDFLGEPSVYKSDWSNDEVALYSCHYGTSLKGKIYASLWKKILRPRVKKLFHSLPVSWRKKIMTALGS